MLNEIKSLNVEKLSRLPISQVLSEYPLEFARLLFKKFESAGYKINTQEKSELMEKLRQKINDDDESPWKNLGFFLGLDSSMLIFNFNIKRKFQVKISVADSVDSTINVEFELSTKTNSILSKILKISKDLSEILKDSHKLKDDEKLIFTEKEINKIKSKYDESNINSSLLNKLAAKYHLRLKENKLDDRDDDQIILYPYFEELDPSLVKMKTNNIRDIRNFTYTFQVETLQKFLFILDKKLKNNGILLQSLNIISDRAVLSYTNKEGSKKKNDYYTYEQYNRNFLKSVESIDINKYENLSFMGLKKDFISRVFKDEL